MECTSNSVGPESHSQPWRSPATSGQDAPGLSPPLIKGMGAPNTKALQVPPGHKGPPSLVKRVTNPQDFIETTTTNPYKGAVYFF